MWWYFLLFVLLAVVIWLLYEWFEHSVVQYKTTEVECQNMPENMELKICLISDLHNNRKNLQKLTGRIKEFAPEVVLLAGDLVNKHKKENVYAEQFLVALQELKIPVYYSAGNHELSLSEKEPEAWKQYLAALPDTVYFLDNEAVCLKNKNICISGLSLPSEFYQKGKLYNGPEELPQIYIPQNEFHIMMAHNPEYADLYDGYHANLIVSGHLHGGLVRLPWVGGLVSPRLRLPVGCDAGLMQLSDGNYMYVSRGLGSHTIPLRFFNRVEVNFLVLQGKEN